MKRWILNVQESCGIEEKEIITNKCPHCGEIKRMNDLTCEKPECWVTELGIPTGDSFNKESKVQINQLNEATTDGLA